MPLEFGASYWAVFHPSQQTRKSGGGLWSITAWHFRCQRSEKKKKKIIIMYLCLTSEQVCWQAGAGQVGRTFPGSSNTAYVHNRSVQSAQANSFLCKMCIINRNLGAEFAFCCLEINLYLGRFYQAHCWAVWKWKLPRNAWGKGWRLWLRKGHNYACTVGHWELPSLPPPPTGVKTFCPPPLRRGLQQQKLPPLLHTKSQFLQEMFVLSSMGYSSYSCLQAKWEF